MPRTALAVTLWITAATLAVAGPVLDTMDEIRFRAPPAKGKAELVAGKLGKAVRFTFDKGGQSTFFTSNLRGNAEWDRAAGLSFWAKGDGSDSCGGVQLIYDDDYAVRYDCCFPIKSTDWTLIKIAWRDFVPVLPGPRSKPLGGPDGNPPSKVSAVWFGKWWYWRNYPAYAFAIDEIRLEDRIDRDTGDHLPKGAPLARTLAKLRAGKPVTLATVGDSLTDTRHWANRKVSWPDLLRQRLRAKYRSEVTIINPALGGTQLRQNLVLLPRWLAQTPQPDLVLFCFGGNDWEAGMRGPQFRASNLDAADRIRRATNGSADVLLLTTVPSLKQWTTRAELAEAVRAAAKDRNTGLADTERAFHTAGAKQRDQLFAWDGVHLGTAGHELMAATVLEAIEREGQTGATAAQAR